MPKVEECSQAISAGVLCGDLCDDNGGRLLCMDCQKGVDPKGAEGEKKTPLHLLPPVFMAATAWVLKLGSVKYGPWNWRKTWVESQTYVGAIRRHLDAWQDGEDTDPESGQSHLAHVAASAAILLDADANGTLVDNRPPKLNKEKL